MCDNRHYISEAPLSLNSVRRRVEAFLSANGLRLAQLDRYVVVTRDEDADEILAGGGLDGNVIKCVAVSESARSEGLMNILVSRLIAIAREEGRESVKALHEAGERRNIQKPRFRLDRVLAERHPDGKRQGRASGVQEVLGVARPSGTERGHRDERQSVH